MQAKRSFALLTAGALALSLFGCSRGDRATENSSATTIDPTTAAPTQPTVPPTTAAPTTAPTVGSTTMPGTTEPPQVEKPSRIPSEGSYSVDLDSDSVVGGSHTTALRGEAGGSVSYNDVYLGVAGKDYTDSTYYTYREYISATSGLKWSPLTWETTDDSYILEYTSTGFYRFALNSTLDGWTIVDEMALGAPLDVTAQYVGRFGIESGESARAWRITLNPNACWANGTPINADSYLYSYKELLNGKMMNRRADSLYAGSFAIVGAREYLYGQADWSEVGILKTGEYELTFITTAPIADPDFYVPYALTQTYLVYEPLWEQCKTCFDADGNVVSADSGKVASITTNYSTSLATSMSYGPYKLTYFEQDKSIVLERNLLWYGYGDGKHFGQYQADRISCQVISDASTALLSFLKGDLDSVDLSAADMSKYASSEYIRYLPQTYTTKLTFNTDVEALTARGTQVLSDPYFRTAFSLAIDRSSFAASYTSAGLPGYGLLNDEYVYDPYTRARYRESDAAKNAIVRLYGLRYGENGEYADIEDAYRAVTGYDPTLAQQYMQYAYQRAVASGLYDGKSEIKLLLSVYQSDDVYTQMYHALDEALQNACRGTGFEGKVSLTMVVDADYYATMESGLTDIIFSTWGGAAYEPYGLLYNCYCDGGLAAYPNQMEYGFDASQLSVEIVLDGVSYYASLQNWARWCAGESGVHISGAAGQLLRDFREYDAETRCAIYADLEFAYLSQMVAVPLYYRTSATLLSQKGGYPTDEYLDLVGFGGIAFYTFRYSDSKWSGIASSLKY